MSTDHQFIECMRLLQTLHNDSLRMNMSQDLIDFRIISLTLNVTALVNSNRAMVSNNRTTNNNNLYRNPNSGLERNQQPGPYTAPRRRANQPTTQRHNPLEKSKVVTKTRLEESCPDDCAICQEKPKIKDSICTECNHYYCKTCWNEWMNSPNGNKGCPTCRKDMPRVTSFKARAVKKLTGPMTQPLRTLIIED